MQDTENKKLAPIFLIVLIDVLGLTIILPLLPFYSERFGASPFVVGLLVSAYALCQLVSGPFLGRWSDHIGRKPLLIVSQLGTLLGFLLLAFARSLTLIFISRVIDGLTAGNLSLAQAYISDVTRPERRAAAFGKIGVAFGVGFFLGPSLTAFLFKYGFNAPIFAAAALSLTSVLCTAFLLPGGRVGSAADAPAANRSRALFDFKGYAKFFENPGMRSLLIQISIFYFTFSAYVSGFALFAERRFTYHGAPLGPKEVGYAFAYFGFLGIILQGFLVGRLVKLLGERRLAFLSFVSCVAGYVALAFIDGPFWIAVTGLFTGFGNGLLRPVLTSEISRLAARNEQGAVMGLNQSLQSVAQIIAPLLGTYLIGRSWLSAWAILPASICLAGVALASNLQESSKGGPHVESKRELV